MCYLEKNLKASRDEDQEAKNDCFHSEDEKDAFTKSKVKIAEFKSNLCILHRKMDEYFLFYFIWSMICYLETKKLDKCYDKELSSDLVDKLFLNFFNVFKLRNKL